MSMTLQEQAEKLIAIAQREGLLGSATPDPVICLALEKVAKAAVAWTSADELAGMENRYDALIQALDNLHKTGWEPR